MLLLLLLCLAGLCGVLSRDHHLDLLLFLLLLEGAPRDVQIQPVPLVPTHYMGLEESLLLPGAKVYDLLVNALDVLVLLTERRQEFSLDVHGLGERLPVLVDLLLEVSAVILGLLLVGLPELLSAELVVRLQLELLLDLLAIREQV